LRKTCTFTRVEKNTPRWEILKSPPARSGENDALGSKGSQPIRELRPRPTAHGAGLSAVFVFAALLFLGMG
jgi:hypothetical protein